MNRRRIRTAATVLTGLALTAAGLAAVPASAAPAYTKTEVSIPVTVGPNDNQACTVAGDLYTPTSAATTPAPAILTTNGFGGSKADQAGIGAMAATDGYVVLSYSGLGFGGSTCKITLDDPDYDGQAAKDLIGYLAGLSTVKKVGTDPVVGMVGGSYGGAIQFATASVDPRLDTIVPLITWNDLSYSLGTNGTSQLAPGEVSTSTSGATKLNWGLGFSAIGIANGVQNAPGNPNALIGCPNFADFVCTALVTAGTLGYFQPDSVTALRHASVADYVSKVKIPTLLVQGENDTLFNLNEAAATYRALKAQGTQVKMIWQSWGHSGPAAPGEIDLTNPDRNSQYETGRIMNWFDHYLKGLPTPTGPDFSYFRDWVSYTGNAAPAYADASSYPVGNTATLKLSGAGDLTSGPAAPGSQSLLTVPSTPIGQADVIGTYVKLPNGTPSLPDPPGTAATWTTGKLAGPVDVVGIPSVRLQVSAPTAALTQANDAGKALVFLKLEDVAPDGTVSLIHALETPVRISDVTKPFSVDLPGIAHRFDTGHQVRLAVVGGSINFRGNLVPTPVTIASGNDQTLTLPLVSGSNELGAATGDQAQTTASTAPSASRIGVRATKRHHRSKALLISVIGADGRPATGQVRLKIKGVKHAKYRTLSGGVARLGLKKVRSGKHVLTVVYGGDGTVLPSTAKVRFRVRH